MMPNDLSDLLQELFPDGIVPPVLKGHLASAWERVGPAARVEALGKLRGELDVNKRSLWVLHLLTWG